MSALAAFAQLSRDCVHLAADALSYRDQIPRTCGPKIAAIPHWPAAISSVGAASTLAFMFPSIATRFSSFNDFIERGNDDLPAIIAEWRWLLNELDVKAHSSEIVVAGIAKTGPKILSFRTDDEVPPTSTREEMAANKFYAQPAGQLIELPNEIQTPVPADQVQPAEWEGFNSDADDALIKWQFRKFLTMQRHMKLPDGIAGIGGFGQLVTVYADRIEQSIICRWDDRLNEPMVIEPIDWQRWHRDNPKPGVSRLRRDIEARKARKLQLVR